MADVVSSVDIAAPPEAIWQLMCDPHRYPEFADPTDRMIDVPDTEVGAGYVYKEYGGIAPFKSESTWRVTEFEPMRRQVHVGDDGTMTFHLDIEIEPTASGSRLTQRLRLEPRGFLVVANAILWPLMMRRKVQDSMDKTVANVKRMLETPAG